MGNNQRNGKRTDLLEQLSIEMGCQYLSDLRKTQRMFQCHAALSGISAEEYSTETWNDAIHYIIGEPLVFDTPEEARKQLLFRLKNKSENHVKKL